MALPKEIRNKIYELLLVVPALVAPRQNRTASHENCRAFLYTEELCLLPGICFVLTQTTSSGMKKPFHRYQYINVAILRISKKVHAEAADVLYGINDYDIANLSSESAPAADFKCRLFPRKYQMLVRNITLRGNTIYTFRWILTSGLKDLKAAYGSLSHLMLLLELPSTRKGWAKAYSRGDREKDELWITRLRDSMAKDIFGCEGVLKSIPIWIDIKVVFEGEEYISSSDIDDEGMTALVQKSEPEMDSEEREEEVRKRMALKKALPQAFELFKRGHRR
ncbi:hypothetical protein P154DRAFT_496144 [Amniculicola lignicola CBS 123094]|uniref:Uncharacterized protein n=1 Tax=Amniculicola lignicola CBS 123094 TaxID=1392246 RepID=A0A6A5W906_9PLEO|nr:hypothetical protein P154DRAFT_496144 [Amniculicola lignicola CBS 123094]